MCFPRTCYSSLRPLFFFSFNFLLALDVLFSVVFTLFLASNSFLCWYLFDVQISHCGTGTSVSPESFKLFRCVQSFFLGLEFSRKLKLMWYTPQFFFLWKFFCLLVFKYQSNISFTNIWKVCEKKNGKFFLPSNVLISDLFNPKKKGLFVLFYIYRLIFLSLYASTNHTNVGTNRIIKTSKREIKGRSGQKTYQSLRGFCGAYRLLWKDRWTVSSKVRQGKQSLQEQGPSLQHRLNAS